MGLFDFLFGLDKPKSNAENYRSVSEDRRFRKNGSGNWSSREDWDCGSDEHSNMSGWDSYEDNDF